MTQEEGGLAIGAFRPHGGPPSVLGNTTPRLAAGLVVAIGVMVFVTLEALVAARELAHPERWLVVAAYATLAGVVAQMAAGICVYRLAPDIYGTDAAGLLLPVAHIIAYWAQVAGSSVLLAVTAAGSGRAYAHEALMAILLPVLVLGSWGCWTLTRVVVARRLRDRAGVPPRARAGRER